ncbi:hypothetical protein NKR23_g4498 [Pleurostoma richardsiae]|uniref:Uncharacterized protein n=1 Tax=Pleurostoma richardsiae TaxID=41990 RepID=A0AA38VFM6_9PEZI|nr:hypothetical protein NKR23_g4498 [Pleurostoma richardsiae]
MINGEPLAWWGLSDDTVLEPAEIIEFDAERPTRDMMTSRSVPSTPQFDLPPRRPRTASTFPPYQERRTEDAPSRGCQFEIGDGHTLSPSSSASPGTISPRQPKKPCLIPDQLPMEGRDSSPRRRSSSQQVRFSSGRRPQADQGASRAIYFPSGDGGTDGVA